MRLSVLALVGCFVTYAASAPATDYVVHEKRSTQLEKWDRRSDIKLNRDAVIPMSFGLVQSNLENGYDYLMDVSHPESKNYGKHWSMDKIAETFAPSTATITTVKTWLTESGIQEERITLSRGRNWIKVNVTLDEAESLLRTKYNIYTNKESGIDHLASDDYSVPSQVSPHIDWITPTIHFAAVVKPTKHRREVQGNNVARPFPIAVRPNAVPQPEITYSLSNCYKYTTPDCLRALYNIPNGTLAKSSYGIVEYTPNIYVQSDLNLFYSNLQRQIPSGNGPIVKSIDGAPTSSSTQSFDNNGESDLDLQYAIALVYPQKVTLYQTGDTVEGASFNDFLDALDSSYCSGDDPNLDATYPDPYSGGYKGKKNCGTLTAASVISTSYGYNEADLPASYEKRQCNEYMKLGLAGTTFVFSSGDNGVAGNSGQCCTKAKCAGGTYNSGGSGTFNPGFPATCPYVTTVGATQIKANTAVTATAPEGACETVIYSGGGFSNVFAMPKYQQSAVSSYFTKYKPTYTATQYNNSQTVRGYPDVSANGANYQVAVDGSISSVYGTSASAPVFGAIIALINEQRINSGKSAVGFINPTLYSNPTAFNDIVTGGNQGCGTNGFTSVTGWDPVTGLGTPNYTKLLQVFKNLS